MLIKRIERLLTKLKCIRWKIIDKRDPSQVLSLTEIKKNTKKYN